jgi:hypothetical protein
MTPAPQFVYWKDAKPEDFINIQHDDWIEGVGHVSTLYEVNFVKRFGVALKNNTSASSDVLDEVAIRRNEREKVYDDLGVIHGEDAKRFHEYMANEDKQIDTPEGRKLIKEAHEWANRPLKKELRHAKTIGMVEHEKVEPSKQTKEREQR